MAVDHPAEILDTKPKPERVIIRPYPKAIVFYPTMLMAFIAFFWQHAYPASALPGQVFFLIFFFNVLTVAFDFTRVIFVATILSLALLVTLGFLADAKFESDVFAVIGRAFNWFNLKPADPSFFLAHGCVYLVIFIGVWLQTRFNYWEVKHNELLHHHGIAGDVERFPSPTLRMSKEITDVFEYALLLSGRLVLQPSGSERPIVLDNVVMINSMEKRIEKMLQTLQVSIEGQHKSHNPPGEG